MLCAGIPQSQRMPPLHNGSLIGFGMPGQLVWMWRMFTSAIKWHNFLFVALWYHCIVMRPSSIMKLRYFLDRNSNPMEWKPVWHLISDSCIMRVWSRLGMVIMLFVLLEKGFQCKSNDDKWLNSGRSVITWLNSTSNALYPPAGTLVLHCSALSNQRSVFLPRNKTKNKKREVKEETRNCKRTKSVDFGSEDFRGEPNSTSCFHFLFINAAASVCACICERCSVMVARAAVDSMSCIQISTGLGPYPRDA